MSDYEFDSDLDREMDHLFPPRSEYEFDSDLDRQMAEELPHIFGLPSTSGGQKRKKTRSELANSAKRRRVRTQTGTGPGPQLQFTHVRDLPPRELGRFHRVKHRSQGELTHNLADVDMMAVGEEIDSFFSQFMAQFLDPAGPDDYISVTVRQERIREIFLSYKKRNFKIEEFVNRLESIAQSESGDSFLLSGSLDIEVNVTKKVSGCGRVKDNDRNRAPRSVTEISHIKRSVVTITNDDNSCGYRAVVLARFHALGPERSEWDKVRKDRCSRLTNMVNEFCINAGLDISVPMDPTIMKQVDEFLKPDFSLTVVDGKDKMNRIFVGDTAPRVLYIEYIEDHYNVIINIKGYVGAKYFCELCYKPYSNLGDHICAVACKSCFGVCNPTDDMIVCDRCHRSFNGPQCLAMHNVTKACKTHHKCPDCEVQYNTRKPHKCNGCLVQFYCEKCKIFSNEDPHRWCIPSKNSEKLSEEDSRLKFFVSFDIESEQSENGEQRPLLLISMTVCDGCYNPQTKWKGVDDCEHCGKGLNVFERENCVQQFAEYLYEGLARRAESKKAKIIAFAHNFGGYDGHFIIQDLIRRDYKWEPILTGSRILKLDVGNVRYLDTLSLFQQPLACLPKSFGFEDVVVKGHFPHKYTRIAHYDEVREEIPDLDYFAPDQCKTDKDRESLIKWHSEQTGPWIFRDEIMKYCTNDVHVLLVALMSFRNLFRSVTGLDPITRNFTLASIGLEYYRAKFLKDNTLGITPVGNYALRNSSMIASAWIDWIEHSNSLTLLREKRIGPYYADAHDPSTRTVYEFNGCLWHGCNKCFLHRSTEYPLPDGRMAIPADLFSEYQKKKGYYFRHGFKIEEIWECDLHAQMSENIEMKSFIDHRLAKYREMKAVGHAIVRDSFFGGRTDNVKFFYEAKDGECIDYKDVTSEYPYVLKNKVYPVGHPTVITENFDESLRSYFGFVKCSILPPTRLKNPILPVKSEGKLLFPLCAECARLMNQASCTHSDDQRRLTGTWTTMELHAALDFGYKVVKVYEVLHYSQSSSDLFKEYIDAWLKVKQEASGWPSNVQTEEEKDQYLQRYLKREGIALDRDKIDKNPGKRSIAKLMLNSFWGKLSQRPNLPQTKICKEYHEYWSLVEDEAIEITGEYSPNDDTIFVSYQKRSDEDADPGNTSVAIASMVTSYARLHLYKYMNMVSEIGEDRLLYFDTDSIIFVRKPGDPVIATGDFLGDLTDELPDGARCVKFVSGGPKNYGYEYLTADGASKTVIKTKGLKHNCETLSMFGLDEMADIVQDFIRTGRSKQILWPQTVFNSHKFKHFVKTARIQKIYRVVSNKKRVIGNDTLPYGWKD